jgi:hypothetical protein
MGTPSTRNLSGVSATVVVLVGCLLAGCPNASEPEEPPLTLQGHFQARSDGAFVDIEFEEGSGYAALHNECAAAEPPCFERGTYVANEKARQIVLTSAEGVRRRLDFVVLERDDNGTLAKQVAPRGMPLLGGERTRLLRPTPVRLLQVGPQLLEVGCAGPSDCGGEVCCVNISLTGFSPFCGGISSLSATCRPRCQDRLTGCRSNTLIACSSSRDCTDSSRGTVDANPFCCAFPQAPNVRFCVGPQTRGHVGSAACN